MPLPLSAASSTRYAAAATGNVGCNGLTGRFQIAAAPACRCARSARRPLFGLGCVSTGCRHASGSLRRTTARIAARRPASTLACFSSSPTLKTVVPADAQSRAAGHALPAVASVPRCQPLLHRAAPGSPRMQLSWCSVVRHLRVSLAAPSTVRGPWRTAGNRPISFYPTSDHRPPNTNRRPKPATVSAANAGTGQLIDRLRRSLAELCGQGDIHHRQAFQNSDPRACLAGNDGAVRVELGLSGLAQRAGARETARTMADRPWKSDWRRLHRRSP